MAFQLGDIIEITESGVLRGIQREIACECWFTSKGKVQPLMLKYQDEQGEIHTIKEILVHSREEKNLMSSPCTEFNATINCHGIYMEVLLVFYRKESRWVMITGKG